MSGPVSINEWSGLDHIWVRVSGNAARLTRCSAPSGTTSTSRALPTRGTRGSNFLNALVKAFDKLHMVLAVNSGYSGFNAVCIVTLSLSPECSASRLFRRLFGRHKSGCL
jgi:hypothetical protein